MVVATAAAKSMNTTVVSEPESRSVQFAPERNRSVQPLNTTVLGLNTTDEWDVAPEVQAADTGKRVEIRYNKRKAKEPYYYWVYRWAAKDADGKPIVRASGTYVRHYEYGGKLVTVDRERLERYEARK